MISNRKEHQRFQVFGLMLKSRDRIGFGNVILTGVPCRYWPRMSDIGNKSI